MRARLIKGLAWLLVGVLALAGSWWAWNTEFGLLWSYLVWSYLGVLLAGVFFFMSFKAFFKAFVEGWRSRLSKRVGERIEGTLILTPHHDFKVRTLRVELARVEFVSRASGDSSETVEASEVLDESPRHQTGSSREYAFAMDVPEAAGPCLETDLTSVGWWLRATVERRMAFDPNLQVALNVYNSPTKTAEL